MREIHVAHDPPIPYIEIHIIHCEKYRWIVAESKKIDFRGLGCQKDKTVDTGYKLCYYKLSNNFLQKYTLNIPRASHIIHYSEAHSTLR